MFDPSAIRIGQSAISDMLTLSLVSAEKDATRVLKTILLRSAKGKGVTWNRRYGSLLLQITGEVLYGVKVVTHSGRICTACFGTRMTIVHDECACCWGGDKECPECFGTGYLTREISCALAH